MTLAEALRQAEAQLRTGPHPERARMDAEALLLHAIGKNRAWLFAHRDEEFGGCTAVRYAALADRRRRGEPLQYIVGDAEFFGLRFRVEPSVLIPRPETEHLVEKAISLAEGLQAPRIADVGTGSGAIAVALAHALSRGDVVATDVSEEALSIARGNAERNGVAGRIRFVRADLLEPIETNARNALTSGFDLIASNPPYVPDADRASLAVEVREYEPALALFAGADGLAIYRRLIPAAFAVLVPGGHLVLEIGYGQSEAIAALLVAAGFRNIGFTPDLQGLARVACAQR